MAVAVQQADGDGLDGEPGDGIGDRGGPVVAERLQDALGGRALRCAHAAPRWHERRRVRRAEAVELAPRLAADLDDVLEPGGGDERRRSGGALEQRVGGDGHAVRERAHVGGGGTGGAGAPRAGPPAAVAPAASAAAATAVRTPCDWSSGVVGALAVWTRSPATRTASVNVPPPSTPRSATARPLRQPAPGGER